MATSSPVSSSTPAQTALLAPRPTSLLTAYPGRLGGARPGSNVRTGPWWPIPDERRRNVIHSVLAA